MSDRKRGHELGLFLGSASVGLWRERTHTGDVDVLAEELVTEQTR